VAYERALMSVLAFACNDSMAEFVVIVEIKISMAWMATSRGRDGDAHMVLQYRY
jgi:hypothetical protein